MNGISAQAQFLVGYSGTGASSLLTHAYLWHYAWGMLDLGTYGGDTFSAATGVNAGAKAVGYGEYDALYFDPWRGVYALPTLGGVRGYANAITNTGQMAGSTQTAGGFYQATYWGGDGMPRSLHPPDLPGTSYAFAMNESGCIVGSLSTPTLGWRGYVWQEALGMIILPPLPGLLNSAARGVNAYSTVVGVSTDDTSGRFPPPERATIWRHGVPYDLNTLLTSPLSDVILTSAMGIADTGTIVAYGTQHGTRQAFVLTPE